ncbi:MAG: hypothetical protein PVH29_14730 [Candidatus Zixiibacteriota bacterium]
MTRKAKIWLVVGVSAAVLFLYCGAPFAGVLVYRELFDPDEMFDMSMPSGNPNVTLANYNRIRAGMTHQQVTGILGGPGGTARHLETGGTRVEYWTWVGTDDSTITVIFKGGRVVAKRETGLT